MNNNVPEVSVASYLAQVRASYRLLLSPRDSALFTLGEAYAVERKLFFASPIDHVALALAVEATCDAEAALLALEVPNE